MLSTPTLSHTVKTTPLHPPPRPSQYPSQASCFVLDWMRPLAGSPSLKIHSPKLDQTSRSGSGRLPSSTVTPPASLIQSSNPEWQEIHACRARPLGHNGGESTKEVPTRRRQPVHRQEGEGANEEPLSCGCNCCTQAPSNTLLTLWSTCSATCVPTAHNHEKPPQSNLSNFMCTWHRQSRGVLREPLCSALMCTLSCADSTHQTASKFVIT